MTGKKGHTFCCILTIEIIKNRIDFTLHYGEIVVSDIAYKLRNIPFSFLLVTRNDQVELFLCS